MAVLRRRRYQATFPAAVVVAAVAVGGIGRACCAVQSTSGSMACTLLE